MESTATATAPEGTLTQVEQLRRRGLFPFFDGVNHRIVCKLTVQFRLQNSCPNQDIHRISVLLDAIAGPPPDATEAESSFEADQNVVDRLAAMMELSPLVAAGFDLPPFCETDGSGLCVQERVALLSDFYASFLVDNAENDAREESEDDADTSDGEFDSPANP